MLKLFIATNNKGKQHEFAQLLDGVAEVLFPADFNLSKVDVLETGTTFQENALLKAEAFAKQLLAIGVTHPVVADDSGLEVAALGGKPGVYSARWLPGSDADRNQGLLTKLAGHSDRAAQFVSVLCLYQPKTAPPIYFQGTVKGTIANQPAGTQGFGYDAIFIPDGYQATFAELGDQVKSQLSHRARAVMAVRDYLL